MSPAPNKYSHTLPTPKPHTMQLPCTPAHFVEVFGFILFYLIKDYFILLVYYSYIWTATTGCVQYIVVP